MKFLRTGYGALSRCVCCFEVAPIYCRDEKKNRPFCNRCALKLQREKGAVIENKNEEQESINQPIKYPRNRGTNAPKIDKNDPDSITFVEEINDAGKRVIISEIQRKVLTIVRDEKLRFDKNYILTCAIQLNRSNQAIQHHLAALKDKGFNIENSSQRIERMKNFIFDEVKNSSPDKRAELVKRLSNNLQMSTRMVTRYVKHCEEALNRRILQDSIPSKVFNFLRSRPHEKFTIRQIIVVFNDLRSQSIRWAITDLLRRDLIKKEPLPTINARDSRYLVYYDE